MNHNAKSMPSRRRILFPLLACVFLLASCGNDSEGSKSIDYDAALADAPPQLAKLYSNGDELIPGAKDAYERELGKLEGTPVVVNLWASWCNPCREEFPYFQQVSADLGDKIAFLGVDTDDGDDAARTFLDEFPLPYPSVTDPDREVWNEFQARGLPATAFYDRQGTLQYLSQIPYPSADALTADIKKYAS